ncbi:MAG: WYL domain-containing protein [Clostridia bacterium]|nr:WYL domain-containing protein [Clostridia bacterium]
MYTKQSKKLLIMNILDILKKYTDADHRLSQKDIVDILRREYDMKADRKAVRRNILDLIDFGYAIEYSESLRMMTNAKTGEKEETYILSDFYLMRDFDDSELRLLIDSLLFSKHIPYNQCKALVEKLEGLSNVYFKVHVRHIHTMPQNLPQNPGLFLAIELLDEAISKGRKVSFKYLDYGTDKKRYPKRREDGTVREYVVSPYQMAAKEGKYYLICNYDKYNDISNYRIDRIDDVKVLDEPVKPFETLDGAGGRFDLAKYMREHVYMFSSENVRVRFRIVRDMIVEVIDMFGMDVRFFDETESHVTAEAVVNRSSMKQFAKSYAPDVMVLKPRDLADEVRNEARRTVEAYNEMETGKK